jgi:6-phosphogluconolactonase
MAHKIVLWKDYTRRAHIFSSEAELARFATALFIEHCRRAVSERGFFSALLSGGRTPHDFYMELGKTGSDIEWRVVHLFQADERWVPREDERNNFAMIERTLLDGAPILPTNVHGVETDLSDPEQEATRYEDEIRRFFGCGPGSIPVFDLILLGLGEDGHVASLFPGSPTLAEKDRIVRAAKDEGNQLERITVTLPLINNGRHVLLYVAGREKAAIVRQLVTQGGPPIPASLVDPFNGDVALLCDEGAASLIDTQAGDMLVPAHSSQALRSSS